MWDENKLDVCADDRGCRDPITGAEPAVGRTARAFFTALH